MRNKISVCNHKFEILAEIIMFGSDYIILVSGGKAHLGAVLVAQANLNGSFHSTSTITLMGHKEDIVVQNITQKLSKAISGNFAVIAGLHWDDITSAEISDILELVDALGDKIITII